MAVVCGTVKAEFPFPCCGNELDLFEWVEVYMLEPLAKSAVWEDNLLIGAAGSTGEGGVDVSLWVWLGRKCLVGVATSSGPPCPR